MKILITDGMAKEGVEILQRYPEFEVDLRKNTPPDELMQIIGSYECIIIRSATTLTAPLLEQAKKMKLIVRAGAGVDNIDVPKATALKIPVMNTASANSLAAAEQTIALIFSMMRQIPQAAMSLKEGKWERDSFKGYEVTGKTLAVIGLGNIGRIVAEKALGLGMKVIGYDPMVQSLEQVRSQLLRSSNDFKLATRVPDALSGANIVTVHVPKTKETVGLIGTESIQLLKKPAFVVNCARGGIVDEKAVLTALDSGQLAGAAFDVFEKEPPAFPNPIFQHPKVSCAPHLGASTFEAQERVALTAADQLVKFFKENSRTGVIND